MFEYFDFIDIYENKKALKNNKSKEYSNKGNTYKQLICLDDFYRYNKEYRDSHKSNGNHFYLNCNKRNKNFDNRLTPDFCNKIKSNFDSYLANKDTFINNLNKKTDDDLKIGAKKKKNKTKETQTEQEDEYYFKYAYNSKKPEDFSKINVFKKAKEDENSRNKNKKVQNLENQGFYKQIQANREQIKEKRAKFDSCQCSFDINFQKKVNEMKNSYKLTSYSYNRKRVTDRKRKFPYRDVGKGFNRQTKLEEEFEEKDFSLVKSNSNNSHIKSINEVEFKKYLISKRVLNLLKQLNFHDTDIYFETYFGQRSYIDLTTLNEQFYNELKEKIQNQNQIEPICFKRIYQNENCDICYDKNSDLIELNSCKHKACVNCWRQYINDTINTFKTIDVNGSHDLENVNPLSCLVYGCKTFLELEFIQSLVTKPNLSKYIEFYNELRLIRSSKYVKCPTNNCNKIICIKPNATSSTSCVCGYRICNLCMKKEHMPISCSKYELFEELINSTLLDSKPVITGKYCPKCKIFIEKNGGCDHMICICTCRFCWNCLSINGFIKHNCKAVSALNVSTEVLEHASIQLAIKASSYMQFNEDILKLPIFLPGSVNLVLNDKRLQNVLEIINAKIHKFNDKAPKLDKSLFDRIIFKFLKECYDDLENAFLVSAFLVLLDSPNLNLHFTINQIENIAETYYQQLRFVQTLDDLVELIIMRKKLRNRLLSIKISKKFSKL